jgi:hypothetical protein
MNGKHGGAILSGDPSAGKLRSKAHRISVFELEERVCDQGVPRWSLSYVHPLRRLSFTGFTDRLARA